MAYSDPHFSASFTCPVCRNGFSSARELQQHLTKQHSFGEDLQIGQLEDYESDEEMIVPPEVIESQSHTFKLKTYRHPRDCDLCKQVIWSEGVQCRVCKYACHKKCELKVMTTCTPPKNYELPSNEGLAKHGLLKTTQPSVQKDNMSQQKQRLPKGEEAMQLQLTYITEKILVMSFPANGQESHYMSNLQDVTRILRNKHQEKYLVINLSEKRYDLLKLNGQVLDIGWPERLSPPLEKLCSICKAIESWLSTDYQNVVVIHSKGGLGRLGVVLSAYIEYIKICNGNGNHSPEKFAMERYFVQNLSSKTESSQMRYVKYFAGLLSGSIQINHSPMFLHCIVLHGIPNFDGIGGCRPFIKVYQSMQPIYTSGVYTLTNNMSSLAVPIKPAPQLRGDIMVICYHKNPHSSTRDVIFRCQFHTCAISQYQLSFTKYELDDASKDSRFPDYSKVELLFSNSATNLPGIEGMIDPHIPVDYSQDSVTQLDSYANFDQIMEGTTLETDDANENTLVVQHMHGPVDGSLYARVNKKSGEETTQTFSNGPEGDMVHTHVYDQVHSPTQHTHSGHNHGLMLELHSGGMHDSIDGAVINDRDHNRNEMQVKKSYLTENLKSPTETIKRGVRKEGLKPNTLKEWFTRRQPNSPADYTHHTLGRKPKGAGAGSEDLISQTQQSKNLSQQGVSSSLPQSNLPQDSRNYPRDHVYRGGFRDDESPYAEIPDYAASSPTSSMTSGAPQTSSFSSLSESVNYTSSPPYQSPTGKSQEDRSPQGYAVTDGQIHSGHVQTTIHDHRGHPGQHVEHSGQSGHVHTHATGQHAQIHHDKIDGQPGQARQGYYVDQHGHQVQQHTVTGQHVHSHPGHPGHDITQPGHGGHVHQHSTTVVDQGQGPSRSPPGQVQQPGQGSHVHQQTKTVTSQRQDHIVHGHPEHAGPEHHGYQQSTKVMAGQPDHRSPPGQVTHTHQDGHVIYPAAGHVQYTTETSQHMVQKEQMHHPAGQPGQMKHPAPGQPGQSQHLASGQPGHIQHPAGQPSNIPSQTSHVHKTQYTTFHEHQSPKSGQPSHAVGHSHSTDVSHKPGEVYHLRDSTDSPPESFHLHRGDSPSTAHGPGGKSTEQHQITRVVQVHSANNQNQPVGVIDVHHPANPSSPIKSDAHRLPNQTHPQQSGQQVTEVHQPSAVQTRYEVTRYEVAEHQHQHPSGEPESPTKQTWAHRQQQQQQQRLQQQGSPEGVPPPPPQQQQQQPLVVSQQQPPAQNQHQITTTHHTWTQQQQLPQQQQSPHQTALPQQQKSPTPQAAVEKQQPPQTAPAQPAATEDPDEGLTWLQKQQKKLEQRRQQEQQQRGGTTTTVTKYHYTTQTDRPGYQPMLSPYSTATTSSQPTTRDYHSTSGGQYKSLSPTPQVNTQYYHGPPPLYTKLMSPTDRSPTGDIDINQLEALARFLQDESEMLDQYTSDSISPRTSGGSTEMWQSHHRPLSRQHSDRTHDRSALGYRAQYGGQTRPYSPYDMDVSVKRLPPPSPRQGRIEGSRVPGTSGPEGGKTTHVIHTDYHVVEEPIQQGPMHGRLFTSAPSAGSPSLSPPHGGGHAPSLGESANRPSVTSPARSEPVEVTNKPAERPADVVSAETPNEEPDLRGLVRGRVAGYHARLIRDELTTERGRQPGRKPAFPVRRSKSAAAYDSETSHRQYMSDSEKIAMAQRRARSPSPEVWMRNPGGAPKSENEYWNKHDGLKTKDQDEDEETGKTPKFPLSPGAAPRTPYANMVSTPIAFVEKFAVPMDNDVDSETREYHQTSTTVQEDMPPHEKPGPPNVFRYPDTTRVHEPDRRDVPHQHQHQPGGRTEHVQYHTVVTTEHVQRRPDVTTERVKDHQPHAPTEHVRHHPAETTERVQQQQQRPMASDQMKESVINGGPPVSHHSQDKTPNGQPPMMHQLDRPDAARGGHSHTMKELYVETQTQEKKIMPQESHVPTLAIAEQTSLPTQHPQNGGPPGQQRIVTRTVVQETQTVQKGTPHHHPYPHPHQHVPESQRSPNYQNHPYPGEAAKTSEPQMLHDHRAHGVGLTVADSTSGAPASQARPEGAHTHIYVHQTVREQGRPGATLMAPQGHERGGTPIDQPLTPLHITEDSSTTPSECSESPHSSNTGYESATLPFPTSSAMMKERLELQRQQQGHQPQPHGGPPQGGPPANMYPTFSDRGRQPGGLAPGVPQANIYPTYSDRSRDQMGHVTITTETTSQYRTMYDNRGRAGDQQRSPMMGRTSRGSASSGENVSGILGSSPRRVTSQGSYGRGSLTGSDRSGSPPPPGSNVNRGYPNGGVSDSGRSSPVSLYNQPSLLGSHGSLPDGSDIIHKHPTFVKDLSSYWYKPNISRDEAISALKDKPPGSFVVRDSNSFPGAFGLAVKVATPPPNVVQSKKGDLSNELVRHFLIEPSSRGVRLKGCANEPVFSSLSALVYQHSITPLALPCKLLLPEVDPTGPSSAASSPRSSEIPASPSALLAQGAACNVLYLHSVEMESLTGPNAVRKAVTKIFKLEPRPRVTVVHFKVNSKGITLTDNEKKVFFRRHHPVNSVTYCGMDPDSRKWARGDDSTVAEAKVFGFVARKPGSLTDNVCHLFAEHDPEQPASAIVNFVTKVMIGSTQAKK